MKVPVISGIVTSESGDFVNSVPINREPVLRETGIADGYLACPPGITQVATGPGADRGGIMWNNVCYRVMGSKLVKISASWKVSVLGEVGIGGVCALDFSFDNLIVNSGTRLYYWNPTDGLRQVTDSDLGTVIDAMYVDGYTMTTDGTSLVVTDLDDPMSVNPLKFGSSEDSPDPITGVSHLHGEVYAHNSTTTQVFQNVGGTDFPFETIKTATVPYGCVGPRAKCKFQSSIAFVGGAQNMAPGVWLLGSGDADKLSSAEVDDDLAKLTPDELAAVWLECRAQSDEQRLLLHTPYRSWGFATQVSRRSQVKTWCKYVSGPHEDSPYQGRGLVYCYGEWIVGSSTGQIGILDRSTALHYGKDVMWRFDTGLLYNDTRRAILGGVEIIGTPGRGNDDSRVFWSYTKDGETWSIERATSSGRLGERGKRVAWRNGVRFEQYMGLRFRGVDGSLMSVAALECAIEPLN